MATGSCCSTPRTAVAGARSATSAQAPCRSTRRSSASATIHISWNCARPTVEPLQRINAKQECRSLETTASNDRAVHHRLGKAHILVHREVGQYWRDGCAPNRALVVDEARGSGSHFG